MKNRINRHLTLQASQQAVEYSLMKKIVPLQIGFSNNNQACYLPFRFNSVDILKRIIFTIFMSSHFDITDISLYYFWGKSITIYFMVFDRPAFVTVSVPSVTNRLRDWPNF